MDTISLYYPKKEIHVIDYGVAMYISNIFTHNQKSHLVDVCSYKKCGVHYMQILLDTKNKDGVAYSILLLALTKFNEDEHGYIAPKTLSEKIFKLIGTNEYSKIKLEKYDKRMIFNISFFILFNCYNISYFLLLA